MIDLLLYLVGIIAVLVLAAVTYARWHFGSLEKLGIPVEKPAHFLFGSALEYFEDIVQINEIKRMQKYGPVFGFYEGREPQIHICDPELTRLIMAKDSDHFLNKRQIEFGSDLLNEMPDFLPYEKWKAFRSLMTPAYTASKLKGMTPTIIESIEAYVKSLQNQIKDNNGRLENYLLRDKLWLMLTDVITRTSFNIKIEDPENPNNLFAKIVRDIMEFGAEDAQENSFKTYMKKLSYPFPFLRKHFTNFLSPDAGDEFGTIYDNLVKQRRQSGKKFYDVLDQSIEILDKVDTPEYKRLKITKWTAMCYALIFFFAGQDQISSIVSFMIYYALKHGHMRELQNEVDEVFRTQNGEIKNENIPKDFPFLNACIKETLRLVPFFTLTERVCTKDWEHNGLKIKEGMVVIFPIWAANRNPEYFPDPEAFKPERFLPENKEKLHPYAFTSFGHGPHNCVGMRFSMHVMNLLAAYLIKGIDFHLQKDTKIEFVPSGQFFAVSKPFPLTMTSRE